MNAIIEKIINTELFIAITNLIPILITILVSLIMVKVIMKIVQKGIKKSKLEKGLHSFVLKTVKIILYFIVVMIVADMIGIPISSLLATFSIVGVAASLAIQDTLSNIASGITILATHPFKAGNYVDAGGIAGTVRDINFTHTVLQTPDNKIIHVPNKQMVNSTVTNFSEMPKRRVDITFNLAYNANGDRIKEIMREAINNHSLVLKDEDIIISELKKEDHFIQREILYYLLEYYYQDDLILLNDKHIELLFKLINSRKANTFVNLPNDVVAYKEYDMLKLKRE